jgi:hypothetical protein
MNLPELYEAMQEFIAQGDARRELPEYVDFARPIGEA